MKMHTCLVVMYGQQAFSVYRIALSHLDVFNDQRGGYSAVPWK